MIAAPTSLSSFLESDYVRGRWLDRKTIQQMRISVGLLDRWAATTGRRSPVVIHDLTGPLVVDWMTWLAEGRSPKTVNNKRGDVLVLWREAARQGKTGPADEVRKMPEPEREPVAWQLAEIEAIFAACNRLPGYWQDVRTSLAWKIGLLVFWDTGCRLAELLGARMEHVRLAESSLFVPAEHRKGSRGRRKDRVYPLHGQTMDVIRASLPSRREMLFPFPWKRRQIWGHLKRILRAAGLPADRAHMFHCLRRSAESYAARERGVQWAAEAIGHTPSVARKHYVSLSIAPGPRLIDALPRPAFSAINDGRQLCMF